jgi:hypothetical protein
MSYDDFDFPDDLEFRTRPKIRIMKRGFLYWLMGLFGSYGITLWPVGIFFREEEGLRVSSVDMSHEYIHWDQQREMLGIFFYLWYILEWVARIFSGDRKAYYNISFEREAYDHEYEVFYYKSRKMFGWFKYINFTDMGIKRFLKRLLRSIPAMMILVLSAVVTVLGFIKNTEFGSWVVILVLISYTVVLLYHFFDVWYKVDKHVTDNQIRHNIFGIGSYDDYGQVDKDPLGIRIFRWIFYVAIIAAVVIIVFQL